ncbi:MAG: PAS domain S-box protein, partial [Acidobacteriota bacterium]|nr:PAS domain S-box protein [Acidobacteriota bacterium]
APERFEQRHVRRDGTHVWTAVSVAPIASDDGHIEQLVWLIEDITAAKHQEAQLRTQKAQLEEAQRMAHIGSYELDLTTGERVWSDEFCRIFGFEPGTPPRLELLDARVHPDDREHVRRVRKLVAEEGQPYADEHRIILPTGDVRIVQDRGRFVHDEHGRALKIVGLVQDMTDARAQEEELTRRALQQVVVANLSHAALSGQPIDALLVDVAEIVTRLLDVELCEILQDAGGMFRIVGGTGWQDGTAPEGLLDATAAPQSTLTIATGAPVVVDDMHTETRFTPSDFIRRQCAVSGITVPISTGRLSPWGVLGAHSRRSRTFSGGDVDFLRSIATVLAQAVERDRVDQQLLTHAAQQSAIAEVSRVALRSVDDAIETTCSVITDVLDVDYTLLFQTTGSSGALQYRAGKCWNEDPASALDENPGIAGALRDNAPVSLTAVEGGMAGGVAVPVASSSARFGVLTAHWQRPTVFTDADTEFLQSLANILADALDRERARHQLTASEERYREVVEGALEIIFTLDGEGHFSSLNAAFASITGWSVEHWIGRSFVELIEPGDAPRVLDLFHRILEQQKPLSSEVRIAGRDGELLLDVTAFPKIENGQTSAVYGFARDVTEARRAAREGQRLTRNLQLLLESTVEGIITVDLAGRCTMSNRAAAQILGRDRDEMTGATLQTLINGDERAAIGQIVAVARSGEVRTVSNGTFWRADGTAIPVEYSAAPITDNGIRLGVVISFSDIRERLKLEAKLEQADRLSSLGRLAATIAHEFNNVLMGISPFVEVIRRGRNVHASLDHIARAVQRGRRITQDILRFTQPAQPVRTSFDVASWVENITLEARTLLPPTVRLQSSIEERLHIDGDANQLQQIFTNLILNARDAMPGGGTLSIDVRHEPAQAQLPFLVERPERFAHFIVRDTGCGISPETQRHIFEPLFTTKKNGTGLGLAVTHQVVQQHGGDIFVESKPGEGTAFHIFIPLSEGYEVRAADIAQEVAAVAGASRVLLVEDDATVATGLVTLLELEGLEVEVASTGREALQRVGEIQPDVVVLDVGLPDMDGTSVYAALTEQHPDLPIVFSTGHADRAKLESLLERPHVAFLLKPYEGSALLGAIRDVMQ